MIAFGAFFVCFGLALHAFYLNRSLLAAAFLTICTIIANGAT